jgi:hypothetical protein
MLLQCMDIGTIDITVHMLYKWEVKPVLTSCNKNVSLLHIKYKYGNIQNTLHTLYIRFSSCYWIIYLHK